MGFTIGQVSSGIRLIAVCDGCGEVQAAVRNGAGDCVLPDGWLRLAREDTGTLYGIPLVRSILACPDCIAQIADEMNTGKWRDLPKYAETLGQMEAENEH